MCLFCFGWWGWEKRIRKEMLDVLSYSLVSGKDFLENFGYIDNREKLVYILIYIYIFLILEFCRCCCLDIFFCC